MKRSNEYFRGCLIGGAVSDALGAPIEFMSLEKIKKKFGKNGIKDLVYDKKHKAKITDDTQMTMFTAEGLLRGNVRQNYKGICDPTSVVFHAYLRWFYTQGEKTQNKNFKETEYDGWLIKVEDLHARRSPGYTCISSLVKGVMGDVEKPINNSKGCGGVMRVAPVGLCVREDMVFELACEIAAITHGHPSGYLAAGVFAMVISNIISGMSIIYSINNSLEILKTKKYHEKCLSKIQLAIKLALESKSTEEDIKRIGEGWVAEEAIAISIYCSLLADSNFEKGVSMAANHSGDSDSTGSITGNILGAYLGISSIPKKWTDNVELFYEIVELADDLLICFKDKNEWWKKYPGW
ncbi:MULTISPECIES: ADP-ribosylglycohydrolase family protein [Psychrilyobacter]|uniref:ADP-ribosylglycohydrolase family protein n=1 Tax=Psychrilyobacter piezotolerans TaxID=2293438 RepID=A0ABX9KJ11_9FUSO|nr:MULTISPECIES: ADP-ribosylglycohydrolase family protein [Psychrilyobacter]MCS5421733.1 ADP-ribosylglycohydrolase family protein [Psychrilyobacter sp. S5]NDI77169.1 ADP-ribosylglycohydrolase family protein [Psychrilyobacter piezotolerans]RDE64161.1 ADP-ribosylglycohydrolase family protein [Psychrilyobacter sp. S5]REI42253.1 ADP-ribosylglycohydrolase family protein [Psychrilyobacter piezotolerans]